MMVRIIVQQSRPSNSGGIQCEWSGIDDVPLLQGRTPEICPMTMCTALSMFAAYQIFAFF